MPKENVRKMVGVLAGVFAHTGHINKKEAQEMAGLSDEEFKSVYEKASNIAKKLEGYGTIEERYDKFSDHFYEEIEDFVKKFGPFNMGL